MSTFAKKHNAGVRLFLFDIPEHYTYKDLKQLASEHGLKADYKVNAIYINKKGMYGDQPVIATNEALVNAPHHMVEQVREILSDAESVNLINGGYVGFKLYTYENKYGTQYAIEWLDIEPSKK
jgi:hypothetical protein